MSSPNPYEYEPAPDPSLANKDSSASISTEGVLVLPPDLQPGWILHSPLLGVLLVLQGLGELIYSVFITAVTLSIPGAIQRGAQNGPPIPPAASWVVMGIYSGMAMILLLIGCLTVFGGVSVRKYRHRRWVLAALGSGLLSFLGGCLCFPTGIALSVYGFVILLSPSAKIAFRWGEAGHSPAEIERAFQQHKPLLP